MGCVYILQKHTVGVAWGTNSKVAHYMTAMEHGYDVKGHNLMTFDVSVFTIILALPHLIYIYEAYA